MVDPDILCKTELERARYEAGNVARLLAGFPAGEVLLETDNHGNWTSDSGWWNLKNFHRPSDNLDPISDPEFWWRNKKLYTDQLEAQWEKTKFERAQYSADLQAPET